MMKRNEIFVKYKHTSPNVGGGGLTGSSAAGFARPNIRCIFLLR